MGLMFLQKHHHSKQGYDTGLFAGVKRLTPKVVMLY